MSKSPAQHVHTVSDTPGFCTCGQPLIQGCRLVDALAPTAHIDVWRTAERGNTVCDHITIQCNHSRKQAMSVRLGRANVERLIAFLVEQVDLLPATDVAYRVDKSEHS